MKLKLEKRGDGWWITGVPDCDGCGPYSTKDEANDDRAGLERTLEHWDERAFWTTERQKVIA